MTEQGYNNLQKRREETEEPKDSSPTKKLSQAKKKRFFQIVGYPKKNN